MRVTSTRVGKIAKRRPTTKVAKLVQNMLYSTFRGNTATTWGLQQESVAMSEYISQTRHTTVSVTKSGLIISRTHPWLAVSPDGLVTDPSNLDPYGLLEIKKSIQCS